MEKFRVLMNYYMKKNKGQYLSFGILLMIAVLMLHLGVVTKMNFKNSFDEKWKEQDTANASMTVLSNEYQKGFEDSIKKIDGVENVFTREGVLLKGTIPYNGNEMDMVNNVYCLEDALGKDECNHITVLSKTEENYEHPIYLSEWMKLSGGYQIGDAYTMKVNNTVYDFKVAGFVEDMLYGNYSLYVVAAYVPRSEFIWVKEKAGKEIVTTTLLAKTKDVSKSQEISQKMQDITVGGSKSFSVYSYYDMCKLRRTMTADVGCVIFISFALLIMIVSLFVSNFKISNNIEEEIQNMGTMKALGYTGKQMITSIIVPYLATGVMAVIVGIGLSYLVLPMIETAFNAQTGFVWKQGFSIVSAVVTAVLILSLVFLACYVSARKIKKLQPIEAIRGGIATHNFKKNHFPLAKTKGNVNFILACKNLMSNMRQNVLLFIVLFVVTNAVLFAGTMFYNSVIKTKVFSYALSEENPSVQVVFNSQELSSEKNTIESMENIKQALFYTESKAELNKENLPLLITQDYSKMSNDICYEGRNPIHSNEIALGNESAKSASVKVGDTITLKYGKISSQYLVTGLIQSVNYNGKVAELTESGFLKINTEFKPDSLYVYLKDDTKTEEFINQVKEKFTNISNTVDYVKTMESAIGVFVRIIGMMCGIIIFFTILLVSVVLYMVTKTVITRKKTEMGIMKALGYTTKQLIHQTALSYMPTAVVAVLAGTACGVRYMNSILAAMLSSIGIMKINFGMPVFMVAGVMAGIIVFTYFMTVLLSGKIRKVSAYSLIKE